MALDDSPTTEDPDFEATTPVVVARPAMNAAPPEAIATRRFLAIPSEITPPMSCDPNENWMTRGGAFQLSLPQLVNSARMTLRAERAAKQEERERARAANERSHRERQLRKQAMKAAKQEPETPESEGRPSETPPTSVPEPTPDSPVPVSLYDSMIGIAPREPVSPPRLHGVINAVFDVLVESGEPMSVTKISMMLPRYPRQAVRSSAANLFKQGVVDKVKPGIYKVKEEYRVQDVRVDVVARTEDQRSRENVELAFDPNATGAPGTDSFGSLPDHRELAQNLETSVARRTTIAEINDVLDLLFPDGFKAKHLPLIDAWRKATLELMDSLNRP